MNKKKIVTIIQRIYGDSKILNDRFLGSSFHSDERDQKYMFHLLKFLGEEQPIRAELSTEDIYLKSAYAKLDHLQRIIHVFNSITEFKSRSFEDVLSNAKPLIKPEDQKKWVTEGNEGFVVKNFQIIKENLKYIFLNVNTGNKKIRAWKKDKGQWIMRHDILDMKNYKDDERLYGENRQLKTLQLNNIKKLNETHYAHHSVVNRLEVWWYTNNPKDAWWEHSNFDEDFVKDIVTPKVYYENHYLPPAANYHIAVETLNKREEEMKKEFWDKLREMYGVTYLGTLQNTEYELGIDVTSNTGNPINFAETAERIMTKLFMLEPDIRKVFIACKEKYYESEIDDYLRYPPKFANVIEIFSTYFPKIKDKPGWNEVDKKLITKFNIIYENLTKLDSLV
jgi:hypothetical protein